MPAGPARRCRLELTDEGGYQLLCGDPGDGSYRIRLSRSSHPDWRMAAGDFMSFYEASPIPCDIALEQGDIEDIRSYYHGHSCDDPYLRPGEPDVLIHSTPAESWASIRQDGQLKSWNVLRAQGALREREPIGAALGDPEDFRNYIMLGTGVTGELIVSSRQKGRVCTDPDAGYLTGARLYFDARLLARDRLLLRDGCHFKVRDCLPLEPYLIWAAGWENSGLEQQRSTPGIFAGLADRTFAAKSKQGDFVWNR